MDNLGRLIKTRYGSIEKFATDVMGIPYANLHYKMRTKSFKYTELKLIIKELDIAFDDLKEDAPIESAKGVKKRNNKGAGRKKQVVITKSGSVIGVIEALSKKEEIELEPEIETSKTDSKPAKPKQEKKENETPVLGYLAPGKTGGSLAERIRASQDENITDD
jgi:hypothetical protein